MKGNVVLKMECKQTVTKTQHKVRQYWMGILARASTEELEDAWLQLAEKPQYRFLRLAETGLAMVQARMGGTGRPFNLGEMTVTRCSVQTEQGYAGHAYVAGRRPRHAELAAVFDALLQDPALNDALMQKVIDGLREKQEAARHCTALKTAATKVDFFTMARGDH